MVARALGRELCLSGSFVMAELILTSAARALGARFLPAAFRTVGSALLQAGASVVGRSVDDAVFGAARRIAGPRLTELHIQGSSEGASIPRLYGRVRIAGQVIWAARFKENTEVQTSGGKGGPRVKTKTYSYTLSFAVGLCEGEIARIGRVWANGERFDLSSVNWRLYRGDETQAPDALIEAVEGAGAPAYRGLAYIVFEDLPLEAFGNVIPQFSFEVVRPAPSPNGDRLEDLARGVCLIPGAGEFAYATTPVRRILGHGAEAAENAHAQAERSDFEVAIDQLAAELPNVENILLVVSWFGTDLRCAACELRPGVDSAVKATKPNAWRVNGVSRNDAYLVSESNGAPAYGGTPSDRSVIEAIQALKARGYKVGLYPFILMDVPADNALPDPYGASAQAPYPWRGRITVHPAAEEGGTPDKTGAAATQVAAFVGTSSTADFGANADGVTYSGPDEWSFRRFVLHHAKLAQAAGGVDFFIAGSELRGLTTARSAASTYPFVPALQALAADVRAMLGGATKITYAADWSEYFGHQPTDGSGDVHFHLDPLWADANIDCVGIDWYAPLTDWRDGASHLDAALGRGAHDPAYLASRIEAGENYDWYYASDADRAAQTRTPITDGAYAKPWVFRAKDIRAWWSNAHYNRPGGVESGTPTPWVPESKPIWFTELGCPAVDKGANAPNLFIDPKSSESHLPPFSSGARDDLIQRRLIEAHLNYWDEIVDPDGVFLWAWDARPYPEFPARDDVWADAPSWRLGHWLTGRAGLSDLASVVDDLCRASGVSDADVAALTGAVGGFIVDSPASARDALAPLMLAFDFGAAEHEGALVFGHRGEGEPIEITMADRVAEDVASPLLSREDSAEAPIEARVRFIDPAADYRVAQVSARRRDAAEGGVVSIDAPLVLDEGQAENLAVRALANARAGAERSESTVPPQALAFEPGDVVTLENEGGFEIIRIEDAQARSLVLRRIGESAPRLVHAGEAGAGDAPGVTPTPTLAVLDLPLAPEAEADLRPRVAVRADPWRGAHEVYAGVDAALATVRAEISQPAIIGELLWALYPGPINRWDDGNRIRVRLTGAIESVTKSAVLNGANLFAVESENGWELFHARTATLAGEGEYELSGMLRGVRDTDDAMGAPTPVGAQIIKLDSRVGRLDVAAHEWGEALSVIAPPFGAAPSSADAQSVVSVIAPRAKRPYAPAFLRAVTGVDGDVTLSWVRRARIGGDAWGIGEPPVGEPAELYRVEILDGGSLVRTIDVGEPAFLYTVAEQIDDFGAPPATLSVRIAQIAEDGAPGRWTTRDLPI